MGGGLMQLVAYGAQDIYLTGNPQITFFKVVYRRHTNFATEYIQQTINGNSTTPGSRVTSTLSRSGDLVYDCYLETVLATGQNASGPVLDNTSVRTAGVMNLGTHMIDEISVEIGGQQIDKQYGHSMEVWNQLTMKNTSAYNVTVSTDDTANCTGFVESGTLNQRMQMSGGVMAHGINVGATLTGASGYLANGSICVPLQFWFNKNPGLALPLIALQYHEVEVVLKLQSAHTKLKAGAGGDPFEELKLWCNYVYLDTDERRRFAQVSHEYLIEQWQWQQNQSDNRISLYFNHPVKELIWAGAADAVHKSTPTGLLTSGESPQITLKLNGTERFSPQPITFFCQNQVVSHHSGQGGRLGMLGRVNPSFNVVANHEAPSICVYSFALRPEEHQPSGTCNFSRIDNAELVSSGGSIGASLATVNVYAINYNVLRIMSGMGGLAYSN